MAETGSSFPQPEAMDAVQHFAKNVTAPLLQCAEGAFPRPIGTATFFELGAKLFLITAAHIFNNAELAGFAVPENRAKGASVAVGGVLIRATPEERELIDVATVALFDESAELVRAAGWSALRLENIKAASQRGVFVLCGYPTERVKEQGDTLVCGMISAFTERLSEPPRFVRFNPEPDAEFDLFFSYDETAVDTAGNELRTPWVGGASGANIWEYTELPNPELWTPNKAIRAVAVQSGAVKGKCLRATTWGAVLSSIAATYPEYAPDIFAQFADDFVPRGRLRTQS